eukprot:CAMPEP_0198125532 /NCGR_PEP_ID=MMETSP1442-20131203/42789_1 /TAXON_ID= /ORGANISM="Craspedostauros australis, Strain CCMP3328" /LENGTH=31 /DNA_ID= /DNA_START= /DNA_END= /DNA_ORIENTATION=
MTIWAFVGTGATCHMGTDFFWLMSAWSLVKL